MAKQTLHTTEYQYGRIDKVTFFDGTPDSYILTGANVPADLEVDLTGGLLFNEIPISKREEVKSVNALDDIVQWLIDNKVTYKYDVDEYGLVVGGAKDGRIDNDLKFSWLFNFVW